MSVLVGTIGYHNLRDYSLGPILQPALEGLDWPDGVEVDEMNWGPIAIVQAFEARPHPYDRVVILAATPRDRPIGTITTFVWRGGIPSAESIQDRVAEAVTGVTSLDNLLIIGEYFGIWPQETFVVDVEPGAEEAGETLTPPIAAKVPEILAAVRHAATADLKAIAPDDELRGEAFEEAI